MWDLFFPEKKKEKKKVRFGCVKWVKGKVE